MSEKTKPEATPEELTKEQLDGAAGVITNAAICSVIHPPKPPVVGVVPFDGEV